MWSMLPDRTIFIGEKIDGKHKMPKLKNSYATFWVIFKYCVLSEKIFIKNV